MPLLSLVANLGLVIFLFLVGLEVDMRLLLVNWKVAASVSAAGMVLPFGFGVLNQTPHDPGSCACTTNLLLLRINLGAAIAYGLYHQFRGDEGLNDNISFGVYLLFIGVAMAITVRAAAASAHLRCIALGC